MSFKDKNKDIQMAIKALAPHPDALDIGSSCAWCGVVVKPAELRDDLSRKEFGISGMCQTCQDETFSIGEEE